MKKSSRTVSADANFMHTAAFRESLTDPWSKFCTMGEFLSKGRLRICWLIFFYNWLNFKNFSFLSTVFWPLYRAALWKFWKIKQFLFLTGYQKIWIITGKIFKIEIYHLKIAKTKHFWGFSFTVCQKPNFSKIQNILKLCYCLVFGHFHETFFRNLKFLKIEWAEKCLFKSLENGFFLCGF